MGNDGDRFLYCCSLSDLIRGTSTSGEEPGCAGLRDHREIGEVFY